MDKSYDDLVMRLQAGHDSQCAMSYGMHEHCCDCSYVDRQDAADAIVALQADLAAARADPMSYSYKTGYAQAQDESRMEQMFCPHCNPCRHTEQTSVLRDQLAAARARVAELERSSVMNDTYTREIARTQRAEAERDRLQADLAAARADATLLRSTLIDIAAVMGMSSLPSYSEWEKIRNKALQLVAALAGERK